MKILEKSARGIIEQILPEAVQMVLQSCLVFLGLQLCCEGVARANVVRAWYHYNFAKEGVDGAEGFENI